MKYNDLTEEQKTKLDACKTPEEVLRLAKDEGYELTDEELDQVAGGGGWGKRLECPECGSTDVFAIPTGGYQTRGVHGCRSCGNHW